MDGAHEMHELGDGSPDDNELHHIDGFEEPTWYGNDAGDDWHPDTIHVDLDHLQDAVDDAVARSGFDPANDVLSPGYLSDIQGITAEYLMADALNHLGDGLEYRLYSDPTHPDADIAAFAPDGTLVRLLQVKATSSPWYAETGHHPGIELIATTDGAAGFDSGIELMSVSAAELRKEIRSLLSAEQ